MPRKLNTLLQRLLSDETYSNTTGNTEPSISYGFFGNVSFKPWKDFERIVETSVLAIERLSNDDVAVANRRLEAARDEIALKRRKRERLNAVEMRNGIEGGSIHPTADLVNELGMGLQKTKKRKTANSGPIVRGPVTNSQSILTQYTDVMAAIGSIMDVLYPSLVLIMDQRMVVGESLNCSADNGCLGSEYAATDAVENTEEEQIQPSELSVQVERQPLPPSATNDAAEERTQTVTRTTSEVVSRNDGLGRSSVLRGERVSQGPEDKVETAALLEMGATEPTEEHTQLLRRSARLANKSYSFLEPPIGSAVIKLRQTADQALFLASEPATANVPVCCFELKGPKLNYTGLQCNLDGNEEDIDIAATTDDTTSTAETSENNVDGNREGGEATAVGAVRGTGTNQDSNEAMYVSKASPSDVASKYNDLFSTIDHFSKESGAMNQRSILLPVIQVLCQALLTQSGCAILTNHQTAIAFRIEEGKSTEKALQVFVSGVIPCDREPGSVAAMLALAKFSLDQVIQSNPDELLEPKKRLLQKLSYAHYKIHPEVDHDRLDPDWTPGASRSSSAPRNNNGSGRASRGRSRKETSPRTGSFGSERKVSKGELGILPKHFVPSIVPIPVLNCDDSVSANAELGMVIGGVAKHVPEIANSQRRSPADGILSKLFSMTNGVIAIGGSGLVLRGTWQGKVVAVKIWNGQSPAGFLSIRNEIRVYKKLKCTFPSLLGEAVPKMLFSWDNPEALSVYRREVVLVTEVVGGQIIEDRTRNLWIQDQHGFEEISEAARILVCMAAIRSLSKLHAKGFLHGDISLRNLRVARDVREPFKNFHHNWNAWWVDLGQTSFISPLSNKFVFESEQMECINLFNVDRYRVLNSVSSSYTKGEKERVRDTKVEMGAC